MGWHIGVKENTLKVSKECFAELNVWADEQDMVLWRSKNGAIVFDSDAMEHMDFLWDDNASDIIVKHGGLGDVVFISADGDNKGEIWGYRFKHEKCVGLRAIVTYEEVE